MSGPLVTHFGCDVEDLKENSVIQSKKELLIREAWDGVRRDLPGTTLEDINGWVETQIHSDNEKHNMAVYATNGRETDIEKINGWLIARARLHGLTLPTHEEMMDLVIKKTLQRRAEIEVEKKREADKANPTSPIPKTQDEAKPYIERLDRVEVKREEKRLRQKERLGKQEMPETYTKPIISGLGNTQIIRQNQSKDATSNNPPKKHRKN